MNTVDSPLVFATQAESSMHDQPVAGIASCYQSFASLNSGWDHVQRGAQRGSRNMTRAVDSVLNLPARAIQVETSVHGQPVAGIVSTQDRGNTPTLLRSNTVLMQKVAELFHTASKDFPACKTQPLSSQ